jgi:hypothetical protein
LVPCPEKCENNRKSLKIGRSAPTKISLFYELLLFYDMQQPPKTSASYSSNYKKNRHFLKIQIVAKIGKRRLIFKECFKKTKVAKIGSTT